MSELAIIIIGFLLTYLVCFFLVKKPLIVALPTERGLHQHSTPTSGGIAIFIGLMFLFFNKQDLFFSSIGFSIPIILVLFVVMGVIDDKTKISVTFRLIAQLVLMTFMVDYVGISDVGVFLFSIFLSMYILNSFNFMDGIDSLAISEFIFIIIGFLILHYVGVTQSFQPTFYYLLVPAIAFSLFNLHPSKLFLGNSGSYLLGFLIALNFVTYGTWLDFFNMLVPLIILYTIFFIETAYVIIRRFTNNLYGDFMDSSLSLGSILTSRIKLITRAHCLHNYQKLTKKLNSHSKVVVILMSYNFFVCLPLAVLALKYPNYSLLFLAISCIPYIIWCYINDAGVEEKNSNL